MVFAPTGVGKSWFAMAIAAAVSSGASFGHWKVPEACRVLYIDGEMDIADLKTRFLSIVKASGGDVDTIGENIFLYARHDQPDDDRHFPDFGDTEHADRILELVRHHRPHLVILDNLSTLASVEDSNAAEAWNPVLEVLKRIKSAGAAVLVVHHANKGGETYLGSSRIPILFDTVIRLKPDTSRLGIGSSFLLSFTKSRMLSEDANKTFNIAFSDEKWVWDTLVSPDVLELVRRILDGEFETQGAAASALGKSPGEVSKMLKRAYTAGIITQGEIRAALEAARYERDESLIDDSDF